MKKILIGVAILFVQMSFGQVTKSLGDFDKVKVFDKLSITLIESSENKIVIKGKRESEVEVVNKNGELKLRMPFPKLMSGDDVSIQLYYKRIESIDVSEGSIVSSKETFKQTTIDLNSKEGGEINVILDVDNAKVRAVSGGIIKVSGDAKTQVANLGSGGILRARTLHTSQTTINVSAGGNAEIYATTLVDAKVNAGGYIYIYGKPKQINQKTVLGGKIEEKEE
ncbi:MULTISPECIES: head GIN domain-containing protein [unclassified Flavobacterium]|uniref:head GIN domain-containing protein n=1 Tax=unclassified Flavobacterium TaxID=196869 RepID=UPI00057FC387|nr:MULTISPECIES: head GIN domain-containing protein [unclassified Flavobacterium]KIA98010.1 chaperonin [Flavobacterium sp. KMS]MEA9413590.1 head GIN domain-containing protein [Flavobacterium sp. PL02]OUL60097.1 chaperonin [Flavobacterium sp. AJR]